MMIMLKALFVEIILCSSLIVILYKIFKRINKNK